MMDLYCTMRQMDRSLQQMYIFGNEKGKNVSASVMSVYLERRKQLIIEIYEILHKLNLPTEQFHAYVKDMGYLAEVKKHAKSMQKQSTQSIAEIIIISPQKQPQNKIKAKVDVVKPNIETERKKIFSTARSLLNEE